MMQKCLLGATLALAATFGNADTLLIENVRMDAGSSESRPARGMRMESVESRFGPPEGRRAAVGEPPISRWEYPGFVVYFERDRVIHSVVRRTD